MDNIPIYGCSGCATTGGKISCYKHGGISVLPQELGYGSNIKCPKHNELVACPECLKDEQAGMSNIIYNKLINKE